MQDFARVCGVDEKAVRKAVRSGRLRRSVTRDPRGRVWIAEAVGRREWTENATKPARHTTGDPSLVAAQRRLIDERFRAQKLKNDRLAGDLVLASEVEAEWISIAVEIRNAFLGVPSWLKQRCPELGPAVLRLLDDRVREILTALAEGPPQRKESAS
jgi:phage terminase Nu1 subunit (DNA packaging protein)